MTETDLRRQRMPRDERRTQLLDFALEVFVEQGYHAASMDEIALRAGVSKPVLYQHFPGKLELYIALIESSADEVIQQIREALQSTEDNKERVSAVIRVFFDYVSNSAAAFRLIYESDLTNDPIVAREVKRVTTEIGESIANVIHHDTDLPDPAAHLLAVGLVGAGLTSAQYWLANDSELSKEQAVSLIGTLAWRGIGGFPLND